MTRSDARTDYKKTAAPKPARVKKLNLISYGKMGKGVGSNAHSILRMGKK